MATFTARTATDMTRPATLAGNPSVSETSARIILTSGLARETYGGTQMNFVTHDDMRGTLTNYTYTYNNVDRYTLTGLNTPMPGLVDFLDAAPGRSVQQYVMSGADQVIGSAGNDVLRGYAGNDYISAGAGNDKLMGDSGEDILAGGIGNDTYYINSVQDRVLEFTNAGVDAVSSTITTTLGNNVENLFLTGTATIHGTGNSVANSITGNAGANILKGLAGNDIINGGAGSDRLHGGVGTDRLIGGTGNDFFVFDTAPNNLQVDTIVDFGKVSGNLDKIQLDNDVFVGLGASNVTRALAASQFVAGTRATDSLDRIIYNKATGFLYYDADGSGAGAAIKIALVGATVHPVLAASNFQIIG